MVSNCMVWSKEHICSHTLTQAFWEQTLQSRSSQDRSVRSVALLALRCSACRPPSGWRRLPGWWCRTSAGRCPPAPAGACSWSAVRSVARASRMQLTRTRPCDLGRPCWPPASAALHQGSCGSWCWRTPGCRRSTSPSWEWQSYCWSVSALLGLALYLSILL